MKIIYFDGSPNVLWNANLGDCNYWSVNVGAIVYGLCRIEDDETN